MKKKLFIGLLSVASILSLAGCSSKPTQPSTSEVKPGSSEDGNTSRNAIPEAWQIPENGLSNGKDTEVTIKFYTTMGSDLQKIYEKYLVEFNKIYPNINVETTSIGGYDDVRDQISKELPVGDGPDISYCYQDHVALFNKTKNVVTLDNLMYDTEYGLTEEEEDDIIPAYLEEGRQFGDTLMYSMPWSKSTEVLYYNKTFFDENNLKVPTSWDEMEAVCKQIKEIDPKSTPLGYDSDANLFITLANQYENPYTTNSGEKFLFNNAGNKAFVKKLKEWKDKDYIATQGTYGSYTSALFTETGADATKAYMCVGSSAGASHQYPGNNDDGTAKFEVGISSIPQVNQNNKKVISQGPNVCVFNNGDSDKIIASWLFVKYFVTSVSFQGEFGIKSGYVPVIQSVAENTAYKKHIAKAGNGSIDAVTALSAKVCLEQKEAYFTSPAFVGSSDARDQVGTLIKTVLLNEKKTTDADFDTVLNKAFDDAIAQCKYAIGAN